MATATHSRVTSSEYLADERRRSTRHEFWAGEVYAMAGASEAHVLLEASLASEFRRVLGTSGCRTYGSNMKVSLPGDDAYAYPDLSVLCGTPRFDAGETDVLLNPQAIVEVLSPSTEAFDRGAKFRAYQRLESLRHYVLVSQDAPRLEVYTRQADGSWVLRTVHAGERCALSAPACELDVDAVYRDVPLSAPVASGPRR